MMTNPLRGKAMMETQIRVLVSMAPSLVSALREGVVHTSVFTEGVKFKTMLDFDMFTSMCRHG